MVSLYLLPNFDFYLVFIHAKIRDTAVFEQALVMKPVGKTASSHTKFILNIDFCYVTWPNVIRHSLERTGCAAKFTN